MIYNHTVFDSIKRSFNIYKHKITSDNKVPLFFVISSLVFIYFIFRNLGLYPFIMGDEYTYSILSRKDVLSNANIPDYLYLKIYSITNIFGEGYYVAARLFNAIFITGTIPIIYSVSKNICSPLESFIISILAVVGPISTYSAYFMPESANFFFFWIITWLLINIDSYKSYKYFVIIFGIFYGLMTLIKPHALFFAPSILFYLLIVHKRKDKYILRQVKIFIGIIFITFFVKFGFGYLAAELNGITIFGKSYSSLIPNKTDYILTLKLILQNLSGHLLVLSLIYGLPLVITISFFLKNLSIIRRSENTDKYFYFLKTTTWTFLVIINLVVMISFFATVAMYAGPYESIWRLSMRHYNFALPLLYITAVGSYRNSNVLQKTPRILSIIIAFSFIYAVYTRLKPYELGICDCPDISAIARNPKVFMIVSVVLIIPLVIWFFSNTKGILLYLYLSIPIYTLATAIYALKEQRTNMTPNLYAQAGMFAKYFITEGDSDRLHIIGSDLAGLFHSLFLIDNKDTSFEVVPENKVYNVCDMPSGKEWILVIGNYQLNGSIYDCVKKGNLSLFKTSESYKLDFKKNTWFGVDYVNGLSQTESWGTWSNKKTVEIKFLRNLPKNFIIDIKANAFGANTKKKYKLVVGNKVEEFGLPETNGLVTLKIKNDDCINTIKIEAPNLESPYKNGTSSDKRELGIGLLEINIKSM